MKRYPLFNYEQEKSESEKIERFIDKKNKNSNRFISRAQFDVLLRLNIRNAIQHSINGGDVNRLEPIMEVDETDGPPERLDKANRK